MEKYTLTEYEKTGKPLYIKDEFRMDIEEYLEQNWLFTGDITPLTKGYELPTIYGTDQETIGLDAEDLLTTLEEHDAAYDGYEVNEEARLFINNFVEDFNKNYADHSYAANKEIIIEPTEAELEEVINIVKKRMEMQANTLKTIIGDYRKGEKQLL